MNPLALSLALFASATAFATPRSSASYTITSDTVDSSGGGSSSSTLYRVDATAGAPGTLATNTSHTSSSGFVGGLLQPLSLALETDAPWLVEGGSRQFSAILTYDDGSTEAVPASLATWTVASGPLASTVEGLAVSGIVFADSPASVTASYAGLSATFNLDVLNLSSDDFGLYAGDGLADNWQVQFFGENSPDAAPVADPDRDGQDNTFEFVAGLDPTSAVSVFRQTPGHGAAPTLTFGPLAPGVDYIVEYRDSLASGGLWQTLESMEASDVGDLRTVTDTSSSVGKRFYSVRIVQP